MEALMRIAYVGSLISNLHHSSTLRVCGIAKALALGGAEIFVSSAGENLLLNEQLKTHNIHVYPTKPSDFTIPHRLRNLLMMDTSYVIPNWIKKINPDGILVYHAGFADLVQLLILSRKMRIPLVIDAVDWYEPSHFPGGKYSRLALQSEFAMRYLAPKVTSAIVVSRFLQNYFQTKNIPTLRVQPLFSQTHERPAQFCDENHKLNLCYAGNPIPNDKFITILQAILNQRDIEFHVIGLTLDEVVAFMDAHGLKMPDSNSTIKITAYGKMKNRDAIQIIAACDFTMLIRDIGRFSIAGFPSSVSESLSLGTPIIGNLTSDLGEFLSDGENAMITPTAEVADLDDAIKRALLLSIEERALMKKKTKQSAQRFDYKNFAEPLADFMQQSLKFLDKF